LSAAPGVTQLGAAISVMGLGTPVTTIAVLAGVAGIGAAYEKLTEKSKRSCTRRRTRQSAEAFTQLAEAARQGIPAVNSPSTSI
jgi:hypothetical protein